MRIILIPSSYLPVLGGLQIVVSSLAREFQKKHLDVRVITARYPRSLPRSEKMDGISVHRLDFIGGNIRYLAKRRFDLFLAGLWYSQASLLRLEKLLDETRADVAHLHFVGEQTDFTLRALRTRRIPLVVTVHGDDVESLSKRTANEKRIFRKALTQAAVVTAPSAYLLEQALAIVPEAREKSQVIPNGVDVDFFRSAIPYAWPRPYILGIGRLVKKKGFDILLDAYTSAKRDFDLLIAGDGEEKHSLSVQVAQLGLTGHVHFLGRADTKTAASLLAGARLFVIPSRLEPFGLVALEARAAGVPIVATRAGGLPEALAGAEVEFVDPGSARDLTTALCKALHDTSAHLRQPSLPLTFTWPMVAEGYAQVYAGLV